MEIHRFKLKRSRKDVLDAIDQCLLNKQKGYICAVNANILVHAYQSKTYRDIVCSSLFNFCDSANVMFINNLLEGQKIKRYPGPNLFEDLIRKRKYKSYFLGTTTDVLDGLKDNLSKNMDPGIRDMQFFSPPFLPVEQFDYQAIAENINRAQPDIIWIGLGAPKQEIFMHHLQPYLKQGVMIGVGAAFNFHSGIESLVRAPAWVRAVYLEWLFRVFQEPKKILPRQLKSAYYLPQILMSGYYYNLRK